MQKDCQGIVKTVTELNSWDEEADDRVIIHSNWAIHNGAKRVVVLSNDSDTLMLILRYLDSFMKSGLKEFWLQYGTGESRRMIPLHVWCTVLGAEWCKVLIKVHILTGNDFLSTIGTKLAAIKADPLKYLSEFAESTVLTDAELMMAEQYLVAVWNGVRSKTSAKTFDELRCDKHMNSTVVSLDKLPPTSSAIKEHLKRSYAVIRNALSLLDNNRLPFNPINNGWYAESEKLYPVKGLKSFPIDLLVICGCKGKCRGKCKCAAAGRRCVPFCHKNAGDQCENNV